MNSPYEGIVVGMLKYSLLMGTFALPPPNIPSNFSKINMITSRTMEYSDPLIMTLEYELPCYGNEIPLTLFELAYHTF